MSIDQFLICPSESGGDSRMSSLPIVPFHPPEARLGATKQLGSILSTQHISTPLEAISNMGQWCLNSESGTSNLPSTATESWNGTQAQKENLVVSPCTDSSQTDIIAKVLYDFQGEKSNELAVKENDMIQIVKRSDQGKWIKPFDTARKLTFCRLATR